jgi:hypothetical protein
MNYLEFARLYRVNRTNFIHITAIRDKVVSKGKEISEGEVGRNVEKNVDVPRDRT